MRALDPKNPVSHPQVLPRQRVPWGLSWPENDQNEKSIMASKLTPTCPPLAIRAFKNRRKVAHTQATIFE